MIDQPLVPEVKATVYKQFEVKWKEMGKAAIVAGIAIPLALIIASFNAGHWPDWIELKAALFSGAAAALGVIVRDFFKPTITVIKGQSDPTATVTPAGTVVTKDAAP